MRTRPDSFNSLRSSSFLSRLAVAVLAIFATTSSLHAQITGTTSSGFGYSDANGAVTITQYSGSGGAVTIPSTINGDPVTIIGEEAFGNQSTVTSVTIPSSVLTIDLDAFAYCSLTSITIPSSVTSIADQVFQGCSGLASITIPSGVTSIGNNVFLFCSSLTSISVDPANTYFSNINGVLFDKAQDEIIDFPEGFIGSYTVPDTVTTIAASAFRNTAGLSRVTIPASVTSIGSQAFGSCSNLRTITFLGNAPMVDLTVFESDSNAVIIFPESAIGYSNPFAGLPAGPLIAPVITSQPISQSVDQSESASFSVVAFGAPTLTYQWFVNGNPISGATSSTLSFVDGQPSQTGSYTVVVANSLGTATSNPATLTVLAVPLISGLSSTTVGYLALPFQLGLAISNSPTSVAIAGLPPGLVFDSASDLISGTPTATGVYNVTITGSNSYGAGISSATTLTIGPTPLVFTPLAGGQTGSLDGAGSAAQFDQPSGLAIDSQGNLYVADTGNSTIRKVTPSGVVTTLAGTAGMTGSADGQGSAALFSSPTGIALDSSGNVYVTDTGNGTIRKITASGDSSTIAGTPGTMGSSNGTGADALFNAPTGISVDPSGNLYVADSGNDTIRVITPAGSVTTLAGLALQTGEIDAFGIGARFNNPTGVTLDADGNVYVNDTGNFALREITPAGSVSTLATLPTRGSVGGPSYYKVPVFEGMTIDASGDLYLAQGPTDYFIAHGIDGVLTDLFQVSSAGAIGTLQEWSYAEDLIEPLVPPAFVTGVARDGGGNLYILIDGVLEKSSLASGPSVSVEPQSQTVRSGQTVTLSVTANSNPSPSYQWLFDGVAIAGATSSTLTLSNVSPAQAGSYAVAVSTAYTDVVSDVATLTITGSAARLINISTRAQVGTGGNILISGFVIGGSGMETLLIRADGPGLAQFGVTGVLAQPTLSVFDNTGKVITSNTSWGTNSNPALIASTGSSVGAFALQVGSADCALIVSLPAGAYTAQVSGLNRTTGVGLAEIYEVSSTGTRLINISTRAQVGTGANILIPGFVISGGGNEQVLVRADGPGLTQFSVSGILSQPSLRVFNNAGTVIDSNAGWGTNSDPSQIASTSANVGAFALASGSADSADIVDLTEGAYTMQISGVNDTTGVALAEVYEVPSGP
jgi:sugar lactone lactonase YvrE